MIEIDSGAATHVCPKWFAPTATLHPLSKDQRPKPRSVTNDNIQLFGYKWVYMQNNDGQNIVIPLYVRNVHQPILSVTRLAEQGFTLQFGDNPNIQHPKGFTARLEQRDSFYYLNTRIMTLPDNLKLNIEQADDGTISAMIAPTPALTPEGPTVVLGGRQDYWTYNSEGFLLRKRGENVECCTETVKQAHSGHQLSEAR